MNYFMMHNLLNRNRKKGYYHSGGGDASLIIIPLVFFGSVCTLGAFLDYQIEKEKEEQKPSFGYEQNDEDVKTFEPGEHIISVIIENPLEEAKQYEYHPGYKPLGIATAAYGKSTHHDAGSCMLYINDTEVIAKADGKVDGELHFGEFGTPIEMEDKNIVEDVYTVDFPAGTHIISVPINDPTEYNTQYVIHEGYEPVGIATSAYGKATDHSSGGCILYVNNEDITCKKEDNNIYVEFGIVKAEEKKLIKK